MGENAEVISREILLAEDLRNATAQSLRKESAMKVHRAIRYKVWDYLDIPPADFKSGAPQHLDCESFEARRKRLRRYFHLPNSLPFAVPLRSNLHSKMHRVQVSPHRSGEKSCRTHGQPHSGQAFWIETHCTPGFDAVSSNPNILLQCMQKA